MSKHRLAPYDTGARLEPQPWALESEDHYGLVDLDDDESDTVFTVVGKRLDNSAADGSPGYLLSVSRYDDISVVEVDGDRTVVVTEELLDGLRTLVELAQRGREDFIHQAESTRDDYSDEDIAAANERWRRARRVIETILGGRP